MEVRRRGQLQEEVVVKCWRRSAAPPSARWVGESHARARGRAAHLERLLRHTDGRVVRRAQEDI
eukprot:6509673-Prymnesium_polylepis.1